MTDFSIFPPRINYIIVVIGWTGLAPWAHTPGYIGDMLSRAGGGRSGWQVLMRGMMDLFIFPPPPLCPRGGGMCDAFTGDPLIEGSGPLNGWGVCVGVPRKRETPGRASYWGARCLWCWGLGPGEREGREREREARESDTRLHSRFALHARIHQGVLDVALRAAIHLPAILGGHDQVGLACAIRGSAAHRVC